MRKTVALILAILILLFSAGLFYVNKILLPVQAKGMVIKSAREALGREVTFDSLQYGLIKGFTITNLTIFGKNDPQEVFLHADSISVQVLFLALVQKKLILPSVHIENLSARIARLNDKEWNFSDLLTPKPGAPASGAPMDIIISGLNVENARIKLTDRIGGDNFSEMIEPVNIKGSLSLSGSAHLTGNIGIPSTGGGVIFDVRAGVKNKTFKGDISITNIITAKYLRFLPPGIKVPLTAMNIGNITTTIFLQNDTLTISGGIQLKDIDAAPAPGMRVQGDVSVNKIFMTIAKGNINAQGALDLHDGKATLDDGRSVSAGIKTTDTRFIMNGADWKLTTDIDVKNLLAIPAENQRLQADITIPQLAASQTNGIIKASSDISIKGLSATLGGSLSFNAGVNLNKLQLTAAKDTFTATGDIELPGLAVSLPGTSVKGSLQAPNTTVDLKNSALNIKAQPSFKSLSITLPQGMTFTGSPSALIQASIPTDNKGAVKYTGNVNVKGGALGGLPTVGDIGNIQGSILINTDEASTKDLAFSVFGIPVSVAGKAVNFAAPELDMTAEANGVDLGIIEKIIPQVIKDNKLTLAGKADIKAVIKGKVADLAKEGLSAQATLSGASVKSEQLNQSAENINGAVSYNGKTVTWKDLSVNFHEKTYVLNGYLEDFLSPAVATSIKSKDLDIDAQAKKTGDTLKIENVSVTMYDSSLSANGTVLLKPGTKPMIDITADGSVSLADITKVLPQYAKQFDPLKIAGVVKLYAKVKGDPIDWQHLTAVTTLDTPTLYVMGYQIDRLSIDAEQKNGLIEPLEIKGRLYDGEFGIIGNVNLLEKGFPFESTFKLDRTNLELMKKDTPLENQRLAGFVSASGDIKGQALDVKSINGKVTAGITEGYLWDLQILSKVLGILSSSFQGGDIIITDANGTFQINDGRVETNNLTLSSATVALIGEGSVGMFDQTIDFNITPRFEPQAGGSNAMNTLALINPTAGLLNIHIAGTLQKPLFEHNVSTPTIIKKTLQNTVGGLLKLFE